MKGKMISSFAAAALTLSMVATSAQAATYTVDTLLSATDSAQSGQSYETALLEAACNCDVTLLSNVSTSTFLVDDANHNYLNVAPNEPGYFLLKFGNPGANDMFFFKNVGELDKLVWTDQQLLDRGLTNRHLDSISHYAITSSTSVPEPASLMLLGAGLAGIGIWRRKFSKG